VPPAAPSRGTLCKNIGGAPAQALVLRLMTKPIAIDLPHSLGAEEAKRRLQNGVGRLKDHIPGGAAEVESHWQGDRMSLDVRAMGQEVRAQLQVEERRVRLEVLLPPMLSFLGAQIEALVRRKGTELLEDKSGKKGGA